MLRYLFPLIFAISLLATIFKLLYDVLMLFINYFFRDLINRHLFLKLKPKYKKVLQQKFIYYQNLNSDDKELFEKRVQKFIKKKEFIARGDLQKVSPEMKALIAASAIQITFGYPGVYFEYFTRILVYPDNYYSEITRRFHQGEVNSKGFIVLSWSNFVKGYEDAFDGRNLGLHEMAHALQLENAMINYEYDFIDFDALIQFDKEAKVEMEKIYYEDSHFFRKYAASNRQEFFAVAVENFFERPEAFKAYHPYLYQLMTKILLQDPLCYNELNQNNLHRLQEMIS